MRTLFPSLGVERRADRRQKITPERKAYVGPNDRQIKQATRQVFGEGYRNGLPNDPSVWLDSEPPTAAVWQRNR